MEWMEDVTSKGMGGFRFPAGSADGMKNGEKKGAKTKLFRKLFVCSSREDGVWEVPCHLFGIAD